MPFAAALRQGAFLKVRPDLNGLAGSAAVVSITFFMRTSFALQALFLAITVVIPPNFDRDVSSLGRAISFPHCTKVFHMISSLSEFMDSMCRN